MHVLSMAASGHASLRSHESAERRNKFLRPLEIFRWQGVLKIGGNPSLPGCIPWSTL